MSRPARLSSALLASAAFLTAALANTGQAGAVEVVATIKPLHSLVAGVMGDTGQPGLIVEGAGSPHRFAFRPSHARMLERAGVVFWVGPELETFMEQPLANLSGNAKVVALGEAEAGYMGVNVERCKLVAIVLTALLTGCAVAMSGVIGFVGLIVPHLLRLGIGPSHKALLPLSAMLGAMLMLIADLVARSVAAPAELPIGIITAALGGPVFLWMLMTSPAREAD
jgi:hypothetical protein